MSLWAAAGLFIVIAVPASTQVRFGQSRIPSARAYRILRHRTFVAAYDKLVGSLNQYATALEQSGEAPVPDGSIRAVRKAWKNLAEVEPWFREPESSHGASIQLSQGSEGTSDCLQDSNEGRHSLMRSAYRNLISSLHRFVVSYAREQFLTVPSDQAASVRAAWLGLQRVEPRLRGNKTEASGCRSEDYQ